MIEDTRIMFSGGGPIRPQTVGGMLFDKIKVNKKILKHTPVLKSI